MIISCLFENNKTNKVCKTLFYILIYFLFIDTINIKFLLGLITNLINILFSNFIINFTKINIIILYFDTI